MRLHDGALFVGGVHLWLGEMLSDNLSRLRGDPVGKTDRKLHDEVTALRWVLRERQAFPSDPLQRSWLDDVVARERDDAVFQRGNTNSAATQRLEKERKHRWLKTLERNEFQSHEYLSDLMFPWGKAGVYLPSNMASHSKLCYVFSAVWLCEKQRNWSVLV